MNQRAMERMTNRQGEGSTQRMEIGIRTVILQAEALAEVR